MKTADSIVIIIHIVISSREKVLWDQKCEHLEC